MLACPAAAAGAELDDPRGRRRGVDDAARPAARRERDRASRRPPADLPNTGSDPRMLFLAGLALSLLGAGLRLRTADADDY